MAFSEDSNCRLTSLISPTPLSPIITWRSLQGEAVDMTRPPQCSVSAPAVLGRLEICSALRKETGNCRKAGPSALVPFQCGSWKLALPHHSLPSLCPLKIQDRRGVVHTLLSLCSAVHSCPIAHQAVRQLILDFKPCSYPGPTGPEGAYPQNLKSWLL